MTDQILEALEIGLDSARSEAAYFHDAMAGYFPDDHAMHDNNARKIEAAIALWKAKSADPEKVSALSDVWIQWPGGECPVADDVLVEVMLNDGCVDGPLPAKSLRWNHLNDGNDSDIIAYKISGGKS
ncbi:hypothetical protein GN109_05630 [Collimonas pratensis]|uniref:hypothetical protein n=1 Tax=Collimonas pratensis TaxID=279113 RepID=UPI00143CFDF2|nr:hypothetical protein [Collimonas pratensis]NKI68894.1 hypothetical protein [Collimonas pratensis]